MNYAGFLRPVWTWLRGRRPAKRLEPRSGASRSACPRCPAPRPSATMRAFRAGLPWQSALHSWTLLDSHDTARFRTVAGSRERQLVGIGPADDDTRRADGLRRATSSGSRATGARTRAGRCRGTRPETWDTELLAAYRRLIALRRSHDALARGGIRYAHVGADAIAYLRETPTSGCSVLAARAPHEAVRLLRARRERARDAVRRRRRRGDGPSLPGDGPAFHVWRLQ